MRLEGDDAYWEIEEVIEGCGVNWNTINKGLERGATTWQGQKFPDDRRRTWVRHSTMAEKYRKALELRFCDGMHPIDWKKMQAMRVGVLNIWEVEETLEDKLLEACEQDWKAYQKHYERAVKTVDTHKRNKQIKCLSRGAAIMDVLVNWIKEKSLKESNKQVYETAANWLEQHRDRYFSYKYLPMNWKRLREKVALMNAESLESFRVISLPRAGNDNTTKFSDEVKKEMRGLVLRMMLAGAGMSDEMIARKVVYFYEMHGEAVPSPITIKRIMGETSIKLMSSQKRYADNKAGKQWTRSSMALKNAEFAGDCWEADGTRVQWQGFEVDGIKRYLYIVAIRDVNTGMYVGWSYGLSENSELYWEALRMAVSICGYVPYELRVDGYGFNDKVDNLFEKLKKHGMKLTTTSEAAGKAKAERSFGTLQSVFESEHKAWIGEGIMSGDQNSRPTADYLSKQAKKLNTERWSWEKAWVAHNRLIMGYNATKYSEWSKKLKNVKKSPLELHSESAKPNVKVVEFYDIPTLFWAEEVRKIANYRLVFERREQEAPLVFDMNDAVYLPIHQQYREVRVRYDNDVLDEVMLFDPKTDSYLATVKRFDAIQLYGPNAEYDRLQAYKEKAKGLKNSIKQLTQKTLDGSERVLDESALSLGARVSKTLKENAESLAFEEHIMARPPKSESVTVTTKKKVSKTKVVATKPAKTIEEEVEIDTYNFVLAQL